MLLTIAGNRFDTSTKRKIFIDLLARIIIGHSLGSFAPYRPNTTDPLFWSLDQANNWWLEFSEHDDSADLRYRYQCATINAEETLYAWVLHQLSGPSKSSALPEVFKFRVTGSDFSTPSSRASFAHFLHGTILGNSDDAPRQLAATNDTLWAIDPFCHWTLMFYPEELGVVGIQGSDPGALSALVAWLVFRLSAQRVPTTTQPETKQEHQFEFRKGMRVKYTEKSLLMLAPALQRRYTGRVGVIQGYRLEKDMLVVFFEKWGRFAEVTVYEVSAQELILVS